MEAETGLSGTVQENREDEKKGEQGLNFTSYPESSVNDTSGDRSSETSNKNTVNTGSPEQEPPKGAQSIQNLKDRLATIEEAGRNGNMSSYGRNKEATLEKIVSMRKAQVEIFRKHMGLELSLSEKVDTEAEINSKEFSESFQKEFHAKENELKSITSMLDDLSRVMSSVNHEARAELLPSEPGVQHTVGKNVRKAFQRSRNQNASTEKQSAWRDKLALNKTRKNDSEETE